VSLLTPIHGLRVCVSPAIPPPDNSLKWKDYVLIFSILVLIGCFVVWALWRIWLPIRHYRREKHRLELKFAAQDDRPDAILRPETLNTQNVGHIRSVRGVSRGDAGSPSFLRCRFAVFQ
jgi:hypothetical protein